MRLENTSIQVGTGPNGCSRVKNGSVRLCLQGAEVKFQRELYMCLRLVQEPVRMELRALQVDAEALGNLA